MSNYDLVIDTTNLKPEEVCNKVITEYKNGNIMFLLLHLQWQLFLQCLLHHILFQQIISQKFVPESFKVYLKVDIEVAVERAFNDVARKDTEPYSSKDEAREKIFSQKFQIFFFLFYSQLHLSYNKFLEYVVI